MKFSLLKKETNKEDKNKGHGTERKKFWVKNKKNMNKKEGKMRRTIFKR